MRDTTLPESRRLEHITRDIPALSAIHAKVLSTQLRIQNRINGNSHRHGQDDFDNRLSRLNRQVVNFFANHPEASLVRSGGSAAGVERSVLEQASNMLTGFETMVFQHSADGGESVKVLAHLQDIANNREMDGRVVQAAARARNDAETLILNLTQLVREGVLSTRTNW